MKVPEPEDMLDVVIFVVLACICACCIVGTIKFWEWLSA